MGNLQCPAEDAARMASVARDVCPFPDYNPSPFFNNMLSINSSRHLRDHYMAVQSSLNPKQLEDFTQNLRRTFGREGRVSYGGVGVVALSLAVLFDTLAKQARGEWVPDSGPIPGLFLEDPRGYYPPHVYTISEYLRLVPYIANNPDRMREETERYIQQLKDKPEEKLKSRFGEDIHGVNSALGELFLHHLNTHLLRITNSAERADSVHEQKTKPVSAEGSNKTQGDAAHIGKARKKRLIPPENIMSFSLNCDPESSSKDFLDEVQKSNATRASYMACFPHRGIPKTWIHYAARLVWLDVINGNMFDFRRDQDLVVAQRGDLDLKVDALRRWDD
ncbi:uncharacterized protein LOC121519766 [Cheilinus undulatus]|uniref:uncharacterized protein LOC121519766 n=1 Tax=Cheilinus undulatus TaxID=241271 RepID=UPI001BD5765F|nr:uncharacterized protein LOC121519766 [Cheilinus undulatus]